MGGGGFHEHDRGKCAPELEPREQTKEPKNSAASTDMITDIRHRFSGYNIAITLPSSTYIEFDNTVRDPTCDYRKKVVDCLQ